MCERNLKTAKMDSERTRKAHERENLRNIIAQWNANRLDLFELSEPNEDLEFHGVMRFYFQDAGQKVATKCIRVASSATARVVIETLIEKFRPDMRMLSIPEYALYEIHENGDERKLEDDEKPLLVQLNWHKDDREGRFLLRRMDEKTFVTHQSLDDGTHFKRKLSKREKKEKKKREKIQKPKIIDEEDKDGIAEKLYSEMPETSFTRSISNPEAVMRRRRQQKLEKKLQQFRSKDGGPDTGGTLKIYGESLCKDVPYKTLLLSVRDNAAYVVKEMLDKYGLDKEDPVQYCLVQVNVGGDREHREHHTGSGTYEYILDDDECPLAILMNHHPARGSVMFHIRRRPVDYQPRKRKKKPKSAKGDLDGGYPYGDGPERLPFFLELNPDGSEITSGSPKKYILHLNVTEVGSERGMSPNGQYLQLFGPNVQPRHCVIAHTEGIVTVTPCSRDAETYVNGQRIYETTILQHGMFVRFGKIHYFRFLDPLMDERRKRHDSGMRQSGDASYDRHSLKDDNSLHQSFDIDGNVDATSTSSHKDERRLERPAKENRRGLDPILPAILELWEDGEDPFLAAIISNLDTSAVQFKLAPTYTMYMMARFRASTHYHPEITPNERAHRLTATLSKVATKLQLVIQDRYLEAGSLAFWMANSSELLHFLKQDRHLSPFCLDAQDILAECVQVAFRNLVHCMQDELLSAMPVFLEDRDDIGEEEGSSRDVLAALSSAMALLRRCRVNAALTIQLFSQLFHFINMWLFNKLVCEPRPMFCTRLWGVRLKCRLTRVEMWAEKQGLELAADCHLSRILQAAHLLQAPKSVPEDLAAISSTCFKLNSLQLRALLERYQPVPEEPPIPHLLIENVVKVAENTADEMTRSDGRDVRLEEDPDLQLPFLLPEDGYSCDIVRGVPAGLQEFIGPFQSAGICRMAIQPSSMGYWTIYMADHDANRSMHGPRSPSVMSYHGGEREPARIPGSAPEPEVTTMKLQKSNNGMGLSIVAARGVGQDKLGIYVKSVVKGGAADLDGRLQAGDQLLKVDGQSLVGISQEKAAEYMTKTGSVVVLEVAKQGAMYHGLATLLNQPSPVINRGGTGYQGMRRMSERDIHSKVLREQNPEVSDPRQRPPPIMPRIQSSKSVPSLNSGGAAPQEPIWNSNQNNQKSPQEVYNPAYSRTSSTASIVRPGPESAVNRDSALRSRSANNLRQEGYQGPGGPSTTTQPPHLPPHARPHNSESSQRGRPLSQPNFHQEEERHYQNISIYQQQNQSQTQLSSPPTSKLLGSSQQNVISPSKTVGFAPTEERMSQRLRGSHGSLNRPDPQQPVNSLPQRPVSALLSQWDREHITSPTGPSAPHPSATWNRQNDESRSAQAQQQHHSLNMRGSELSNRPLNRSVEGPAFYADDGQSEHVQNPLRGAGGGGGGGLVRDSARSPERPRVQEGWRNERDLIRQEAKMEEMREEVRRREERLARERKIQDLQQQQRWGGGGGGGGGGHLPADKTQYPSYPDRGPQQRGPPPTTPKPRFPPVGQMPPQMRPSYAQEYAPERPPPPAEELMGHRDSPQPPPPPPSSTHPLYQQQQQQIRGPPQGGYRYGPGGIPASRSVDQFDRLHSQSTHDHIGGAEMMQSRSMELPLSALSPSPWDREEKEKERKKRLDEVRRMRDQEIDELESLLQRTLKQEERLRTLRLEQEFQRRAEEVKNEDEEENEDEDDVIDRRGLLRLVQEDLERARMKRIERENERLQSQQQQQVDARQQDRLAPASQMSSSNIQPTLNHSEEWLRRQQEIKEQRREQQMQDEQQRLMREKQQKLEEANRIREQKKEQERAALRELQIAREAEERLLREAQKRQEEEIRRERAIQQQQLQYSQHKIINQNSTYGQYSSNYGNQMSNNNNNNNGSIGPYSPSYHQPGPLSPPSSSGSQRLDSLLKSPHSYGTMNYNQADNSRQLGGGHLQMNGVASSQPPPPPPPPERKASYNARIPDNVHWDPTMPASPSSKENAPPKRVSFHDTKLDDALVQHHDTLGGGNNNNFNNNDHNKSSHGQNPILDESLISTPNNIQQPTFTVGSTPGVIGAQEVYRDPRQRIEASRQPLLQTPRGPGPEQLSFREKMKKFALETGEDTTPRDKVKISKAQREIETNLNAPR